MNCAQCRYFSETTDGVGFCSIRLPQWVAYAAFDRQCRASDGCDLGEAIEETSVESPND